MYFKNQYKMNLSKEINDKHIFGISKLLSFMLFATKTAVLKRSTLHQTVLYGLQAASNSSLSELSNPANIWAC